jgi:hypothetical protein
MDKQPVGAVGSSFVYETPKGLNGPTGAVPCSLDEARARIAALEAELMAALEAALASLRSAFSDPAPADLPDPPRRPDGTLMPQPKPWTPPKDREPPRRIGG